LANELNFFILNSDIKTVAQEGLLRR
jgi:hypothetical protein